MPKLLWQFRSTNLKSLLCSLVSKIDEDFLFELGLVFFLLAFELVCLCVAF